MSEARPAGNGCRCWGQMGALAAVFLFGVLPAWLQAQEREGPTAGIRLQTTVDADSITVGERLHVRYIVDYSDSLEMLPLTELDTGSCRLLSIRWDEEKLGGRRRRIAKITLLTLDLEEAYLPGARLRFLTPSGDTLIAVAKDAWVAVRSLAGAGGDLKPLKDPWTAPADYLFYILAACLVVLLAVGLYLWLRRRRHRVIAETPKPELPPDFVALQELNRIERMKLLEQGEFKRHYTLVTEVIRRYLEKRFGIDAMDRTTSEILSDLWRDGKPVDGLEELLREADLVKFAKFIPGIEAGKRNLEAARRLVVQTTPPSVPEVRAQAASQAR